MLWIPNLVYGAIFASTILANSEARSTYSVLSPPHHRRADSQLKNLTDVTLLQRSDVTDPESAATDPEADQCEETGLQLDVSQLNAFASYGKSLYRAWQAQPENTNLLSEWSIPNNFKIDIKPQFDLYDKYTLKWPKAPLELPVQKAEFIYSVNEEAGAFHADRITRGDLPDDFNFSEIAWYIWWLAIQRATNRGGDNYSYSELKRFYIDTDTANDPGEQTEEDNITNAILSIAFDSEEEGTKVFNPTGLGKGDNSNPFWAVLGSPHVASIVLMLTERKADFKGNGITSLMVTMERKEVGPVYWICAQIGPA